MRRTILLVAVVALAATLFVPATAAESPGTDRRVLARTAAEGTWTWVNTAWEVWKTTEKVKYVSGSEEGTWTGSLEGSSSDTFGAKIWRHGGGLWAVLNISFTGTVEGKAGTLEILTDLGRGDPCGTWTITSGTGDLTNMRGHGTWCWADEGAEYSGILKEYVPSA